ncbi:MAG TPA: SDR family oxidoreductase [Roseiarcus sp.]|nr:SDR family oxidoreductase [Roseiarcus sp.]
MAAAAYPSLKDRVVLITGGASGIGAAMVEAFVAQGAAVAFVDILAEEAQALAQRLQEIGKPPLFIYCDLTDMPALAKAIEQVRAELGPIQSLVNNAANDWRYDVDEVTEDVWDGAIAINLKHQFFAAQAARKQMRERGGGSIINFSSIAWMAGAPRLSVYATAKAGVVGLTNSLAREFGADNIRVNAIAPGAVITERQMKLWHSEADVKAMVSRQCIRRTLIAEDVAKLALFLAADDSAMITKQCIIVDGGLR